MPVDFSKEQCEVCRLPFTFTRRRHWCRACGRTICSNCSSAMVDSLLSFFKKRHEDNTCILCQQRQQTIPTSATARLGSQPVAAARPPASAHTPSQPSSPSLVVLTPPDNPPTPLRPVRTVSPQRLTPRELSGENTPPDASPLVQKQMSRMLPPPSVVPPGIQKQFSSTMQLALSFHPGSYRPEMVSPYSTRKSQGAGNRSIAAQESFVSGSLLVGSLLGSLPKQFFANRRQRAAEAASRGTEGIVSIFQSYVIHSVPVSPLLDNIIWTARAAGRLARDHLRASAQLLIDRHPVLRSTFRNGQAITFSSAELNYGYHSARMHQMLSSPKKIEKEDAIARWKAECWKRFDLSSETSLFRLLILRENDTDGQPVHRIALVFHRSVADLTSVALVVEDLRVLYQNTYDVVRIRGDAPSPQGRIADINEELVQRLLPALPADYDRYTQWEQQYLLSTTSAEHKQFWNVKLAEADSSLELPTLRPRVAKCTNYSAACIPIHLPVSLRETLDSWSSRKGTSLHATLLASYALLLQRHTGQDSIIVAVAHSARIADEFEDVVGPMTNYVPHIFRADRSSSVEDFVTHVKRLLADGVPAAAYPFPLLGTGANDGRYPVAQVAFVDESVLPHAKIHQLPFVMGIAGETVDFAGLRLSSIGEETCTTMFDLELHIWESDGVMHGAFIYAVDCLDGDFVQRFARNYLFLLNNIISGSTTIATVPIINADERDLQLCAFNKTELESALAEQKKNRGVHALVADASKQFVDRPALSSPEEHVTFLFSELEKKSNRLAHLLCSNFGAKPGVAVAICMQRCAIQILCTYATLKTGAAYLPLDPSYPIDRLDFMLKDSPVCCVLTSKIVRTGLLQNLFKGYTESPALDIADHFDELTNAFAKDERSPPDVSVEPNAWSYIIYTSGSTGKPKGVLMRHGALINLIMWQNSYFPRRASQELSKPLNVLQFSPISFDVSFQEVYSTWSLGGCVFVVSEDLRHDPLRLLRFIIEHNIHRIFLPFVALSHIAEAAEENKLVPKCLTDVITAGEQLIISRSVRNFFDELGTGALLHNHYGPSETHVCSFTVLYGGTGAWPHLPPIGKPISNTQLYVVDDNLGVVPLGVVGELCIAGGCLGAGYLNRPDVTDRNFVKCPFPGASSAKMYRTGDLVQMLPDGNVMYIRRKDTQVKIRGFRVELGEIEAALCQHPSIRKCCVIVRDDANTSGKRLVAYVVLNDQDQAASAEIKAHLRVSLPEYMVPAIFVRLDKLPLTPSGKINRRALPEPPLDVTEGEMSSFIEPQSGTETIIAAIWREVLMLKKISAAANFFEIGGHSLSIAKVLSRIRTKFSVEIPVADAFNAPTIIQMANLVNDLVASSQAADNIYDAAALALSSSMDGAGIPLTFNQQSMVFLSSQNPDAAALYNIPLHGVLCGAKVSTTTFKEAFQQVLNHHPSLRTTYSVDTETGAYTQMVHPHQDLDFNIVNCEEDPTVCVTDKSCVKVLLQDAVRPFNLETDSLMRVTIFEFVDASVLQIVFHHIATDLWSISLIFNDLIAAISGESITTPLMSRPAQYTDYVAYLRQQSISSFPRSALAWKHALRTDTRELPLLDFPADRPRPAIQSHRGGLKTFVWPDSLAQSIQKMCEKTGTTLYIALVSFLFATLHKFTRQDEIVVGTPMACRNVQKFESTVGYFVNTVPIVQSFLDNPTMTFSSLLSECRRALLFALQHQEYPFPLLADNVAKHRSVSTSPVFQVLFTFQKPPVHEELVPFFMYQDGFSMPLGGNVRWQSLSVPSELAMYDLVFQFAELPGRKSKNPTLCACIEYNADLYLPESIDSLADIMQLVAEQVTHNPEMLLGDVRTLRATDVDRFLGETNAHPASSRRPDQSQKVTFGELEVELCDASQAHFAHVFAHVCASHSNDIALHFGYRTAVKVMTFGQLHSGAAGIAALLVAKYGSRVETITAVCVRRSIEMIVAFVSVLLSGGAYLPVDPAYPADRIAFMLQNSGARVVITTEQDRGLFAANTAVDMLLIEDLITQTSSLQAPLLSLSPPLSGSNLAYVIYTSGSTGTPKGTMLLHRGLVNMAFAIRHDYHMQYNKTRSLLFASASFDASVLEIFSTLLNACTVVMLSPTAIVGETLGCAMNDAAVTLAVLPPAVLGTMSEEFFPPRSLEVLVTAGEAINEELLSKWRSKIRMLNAYGPTENTVASSVCDYNAVDWKSVRSPPIGKPLPNCRCYVVDSNLKPTGRGVPGELVVSGPGVARGYLNLPEKTASVFVNNPFEPKAFPVMYRTGDLVRWLPCLQLEFLGRIDSQVKLRGYRIELGEVEAIVSRFTGVAECAVDLRELQTGKALVAYIVMKESTSEDIKGKTGAQLRTFVKQHLPDYMIPATFVTLPRLPLNPSGKVDRKSLPPPYEASASTSDTLVKVSAQTPTEAALLLLFREVLGPTLDIGVQDNFFDLGGHSLAAMQLVSRIRESLNVELPLAKVFENPTISSLCESIDALRGDGEEDVALTHRQFIDMTQPTEGAAECEVPLSHSQEPLWYSYVSNRESTALNVLFACALKQPEFDVLAFEKAICSLVQLHPTLRCKFKEGPTQQVLVNCSVPIVGHLWGFKEQTPQAQSARIERDLHTVLHIENGEVFKVFLYSNESSACTHFALLFHHIVVDLQSVEVVVSQLRILYEAARLPSGILYKTDVVALKTASQRILVELRELLTMHAESVSSWRISFLDYVFWSREAVASAKGDKQLGYWQRQLAGHPATTELTPDFERPNVLTHAGGNLVVPFEPELAAKIALTAKSLTTTTFTLLLTSVMAIVHRLTKQSDLVIGTPVSGRTRVELENLVGDFVNVLPIRVQFGEAGSEVNFRQLSRLVKNSLVGALMNQEFPFGRIVQRLLHHRHPSRHPIFQILFVQDKPHHTRAALSPFLFGTAGGLLPFGAAQTIESVPLEEHMCQYDLVFAVSEGDSGRIECRIQYAKELFREATVKSIVEQWLALLNDALDDPKKPIKALSRLSTNERKRMFEANEKTARNYEAMEKGRCLYQLLEDTVQRQPDSRALFDSHGTNLTYKQLDAAANRLARTILRIFEKKDDKSRHIDPEIHPPDDTEAVPGTDEADTILSALSPKRIVAIFQPRSVLYVLSIVATAKSGAAYTPIDVAVPSDRVSYILDDCGASIVLTQRSQVAALQEALKLRPVLSRITVLPVDNILCTANSRESAPGTEFDENESNIQIERGIAAQSPVYIIYTSGSTGMPKGVLIHNSAVVNLCCWFAESHKLGPGDVVAQCLGAAFDPVTLELWPAFYSGAAVVIMDDDAKMGGPEATLGFLVRFEVTHLTFPAALTKIIVDRGIFPAGLKVRQWDCGGDKFKGTVSPLTFAFANAYGPTETTVQCSQYFTNFETPDGVLKAPKHPEPGRISLEPPLGTPTANTALYVLDDVLQPAPCGTVGELCVGGAQVGIGYKGKPTATARAFVPDPFKIHTKYALQPRKPDGTLLPPRIYRTGDLVRMDNTSQVFFLGRRDFQVKIRGFRIELGEVEAVTAKFDSVQLCSVVALAPSESDEKKLYAFVTLKREENVDERKFRSECTAYIKRKLPHYMQPAIVILDEFPLTVNGKVDRAKLQAPESIGDGSEEKDFVPPTTQTEKVLCNMWEDILHSRPIGVTDNWYEKGGSSLTSTILLSKVRQVFQIEIGLSVFFANATIGAMAKIVEHRGNQSVSENITGVLLRDGTTLDPSITPVGMPRFSCDAEIMNIFVTGVTGFFGAFLLAELLCSTKANLYCLVRAATEAEATKRVLSTLIKYEIVADPSAEGAILNGGIDLAEYGSRILPVIGDLSKPNFGLSQARFIELASTVDAIIHNGALVNFGYPYVSLKAPNVDGTISALRLATTTKLKGLHYVSTLSVLPEGDKGTNEVAELPLTNPTQSLHGGYTQSKWVAERLVTVAHDRGVPTTIFRLGRITGHSQTGATNHDDFLNLLLKGCLQMRCAPLLKMPCDMTPVDFCARALVHTALHSAFKTPGAPHIFHVATSSSMAFEDIFKIVLRACGESPSAFNFKSYAEWRNEHLLKLTNESHNALLPLVPLFGPNFEEDVQPLKYCNDALLRATAEIEPCPPTDESLVMCYANYFYSRGFFPVSKGALV